MSFPRKEGAKNLPEREQIGGGFPKRLLQGLKLFRLSFEGADSLTSMLFALVEFASGFAPAQSSV